MPHPLSPTSRSKAPDAPCELWLDGKCKPIFLRSLIGSGFVALYFAGQPAEGQPFSQADRACPPGLPFNVYTVVSHLPEQPWQEPLLVDGDGGLARVFAVQPGSLFLIRPDGHIAARRRRAQPSDLPTLLCKACGMGGNVEL